MSFHIVRGGMLSLLQDYGRYGYQHIGVTSSGPMDEHAFLWANKLLSNNVNATQIEITFGGLTLVATKPTEIAITGANLGAHINDRSVQPWQTYNVVVGDTIKFSQPIKGLRAYLAVKGGLHVQPHLGSTATVVREGIGGINKNGVKLKDGDKLEYSSFKNRGTRAVSSHFIPDYSLNIELGLIPSYQFDGFSKQQIDMFFSSTYQVSDQMDRMGYRLKGKAITYSGSGIISEGISMGAVQIPQDGQPIVLLRDRQTIGGYPKIGCISTLDCSLLAQQKPGDNISFKLIDIQHEQGRRQIFNQFFFE
jgi:biotin-dependent carboxylase-like uncharacterized protein